MIFKGSKIDYCSNHLFKEIISKTVSFKSDPIPTALWCQCCGLLTSSRYIKERTDPIDYTFYQINCKYVIGERVEILNMYPLHKNPKPVKGIIRGCVHRFGKFVYIVEFNPDSYSSDIFGVWVNFMDFDEDSPFLVKDTSYELIEPVQEIRKSEMIILNDEIKFT